MDGLTNRHLADLPALVRQAADGDTTATASLKEPAVSVSQILSLHLLTSIVPYRSR